MKKLLTAFLCSILFTATAHASTTLESVNVYLGVLNGAGTLTGYGGVGSYTALTATGGTAGTTEDCATGVTKIHCQNFETATTGYDHSETWTQQSGSGCSYAPATTSSPLRGTQSLVMTGTSAAECFTYPPVFTASATYSVFFRMTVTAGTSPTSLVRWYNAALTTPIGEIGITGPGPDQWYIKNGTTTQYSTGGTFAVGTEYYVWCDWTAGTGTNGTMYLYVATSTTKPGSPTASITTGDANTNTVSGEPDISGAVTVELDQWMESTSVMGSVTP